jgi:hypothetical protein
LISEDYPLDDDSPGEYVEARKLLVPSFLFQKIPER